MKLIFCMQIHIYVSYKYKFISTLWGSRSPTKWYYHCWWAWLSILKVLKVKSMQYLCNILKKKLGMEFIFCMQKNIKVSTSWHYCFCGQTCPKYLKSEVGNIFARKKKYYNCFSVLLWCKKFRYFTGVQSCLLSFVFR